MQYKPLAVKVCCNASKFGELGWCIPDKNGIQRGRNCGAKIMPLSLHWIGAQMVGYGRIITHTNSFSLSELVTDSVMWWIRFELMLTSYISNLRIKICWIFELGYRQIWAINKFGIGYGWKVFVPFAPLPLDWTALVQNFQSLWRFGLVRF